MKRNTTSDATELRRQAEAKLRERHEKGVAPPATEADTRRLVQELEVHQIELEMQNAELVQSRAEVEALLLQYTLLYDFAPVGYFTLASDGAIRKTNLAGADLLGVKRVELIGRRFGLFVSVESRPAFSTFLEKVFSTRGSKETGEVTLLQGGTHPPWAQIEATCLEDGQECSAVLVDITARKRAESELRKSEESYRDLVENAHDIIYSHDLQGNYTSSNKAGAELTGYTLAETLNLNIAAMVAPDYFEKARQMQVRILAGEKTKAYELEMVAKDGRRIPVEVNTRLVLQDGLPVGVAGIARDITERKAAGAELRRLAAAVEQTADSIIITDTEGNIQYVNAAFERISGYAKEEVLNQNPRMLKSGKMDPVVYKELWETIARGGVWIGHLTNRKKDGSLFDERVTISSIYDESHEIVNYVAVKQDISEFVQLEEQLRQSQKMEAIGQLAGGVAHDFNNLLTGINGYSSLALQRIDGNHPIKSYLEEIRKAGERAANLTRQLLAFGRKQILQPKVLDLNSVVFDLDKMLRRLIGEDIDLLTITEPELGQVKADPGQIEQVILNLAVNARDAMPDGGQLTIQTSNVRLSEDYAQQHVSVVPGNYVMLAISDNGSGMDMDTRERVFEPFFTTKGAGKGTGLGLSTVYGIVKQSGGNTWVYSEVGKGTTFKIYLPRVDEPRDGSDAQIGAKPMPRGTETILLVEDEEQVRQIAEVILENQGYQVLVAVNGEQALTLVEQHDNDIDLMITDVVMPQMGGRELGERLSSSRPGMRVLYMSGYTDDAIVRHGLMDERLEFIEKPFTADGLARKVRMVLDSGAGTIA
jgi:two-component system cell cycle sensor histidine kinase/response regulator CckA